RRRLRDSDLPVCQAAGRGSSIMQSQAAFVARLQYPLSLRERVRVRGFFPRATGPLARLCRRRAQPFTPSPLPEAGGAKGAILLCCLLTIVLLLFLGSRAVDACPQLALAPHARWQVTAHQGVFWLVTPCGERFLSLGVNVLNPGYPQRVFQERLTYHWGTF